jgi:hypothetical protein
MSLESIFWYLDVIKFIFVYIETFYMHTLTNLFKKLLGRPFLSFPEVYFKTTIGLKLGCFLTVSLS